jgi:hypothetical protein
MGKLGLWKVQPTTRNPGDTLLSSSTDRQRAESQPHVAALRLWVLFGAVAGAFLTASYVGFPLMLLGSGALLPAVGIASVIGGVIGGSFAAGYRARRPRECSLCTWLGFLLGLLFGAVILLGGFEELAALVRPKSVAGVLFTPAMLGLLVGGVMDRFVERWLFPRSPSEEAGA